MRAGASFLLLLVMLLAMDVVGPGAAPLGAQPAAEIAFLGVGGSVWVVDAAGVETSQLTGGAGFTALEWSPDGERLALVKGVPPWEPQVEIFVVEADGRELRKVSDGYSPVWLPDGEHILYASNFSPTEEGSEQALKVFSLEDGSERTLVTRRWVSGLWPIERLWYSPDGDMIAVYVAGLEMEGFVVLLDAEGNTIWEIPDYVYSADSFAWSPDGRYVVYRDSGEPFVGGRDPALKIVEVETQKVVASLPQAGFWPRWCPNGEKVAAFLWQEGGDFLVTMVDASSGEVIFQSEQIFGDMWSARPHWSPDGSLLLFASLEDGESQVYVMDQSGGLHAIARGQDPTASWSSEGTQIALAMGEEGSRGIYVVQADGSDLRRVADGYMPRWRPTGGRARPAAGLCELPILGSSAAVSVVLVTAWHRQRRHSGKWQTDEADSLGGGAPWR